MPAYDYGCPRCGPFTAVRPMAEYDRPVPCPGCASPAPRVLLTVPALAGMDGAARAAMATNERSAHAPRRSGGHGGGCGCCGPKPGGASSAARGFPGTRPWMICH